MVLAPHMSSSGRNQAYRLLCYSPRGYRSASACVEDLLRSHKTPRQDRDPSTVADAIAQLRRNGLGEHVGESKKTEGVAAPHDDWIPWLRE
jgi:hypothetical protein